MLSATAAAREGGRGSHRIFTHPGIPDLDACSAFGATPDEALRQVEIAKEAWLKAARAEHKPIPKRQYRPVIYQGLATA